MKKRWISVLMLGMLLRMPTALASDRADVTLNVKPVYQTDYTTTLFTYHGEEKSVASSGCGAACLSMAMRYLDASVEQDPEALLLWVYANGYYQGAGIGYAAMQKALEAFGFSGEWIAANRLKLREALEAGYPVIAYMGEGHFGTSGHYILVYGIDSIGRVRVIDPNSEKRSQILYRSKTIIDEAGGSYALLICKPKAAS